MGSLESDHPPVSAHDVDYVTGAGMMLRSKMVRSVGLLPDDWFLYFEETAYNVLAQRRGWRTMINPRSRLRHFKRSTGELPRGTTSTTSSGTDTGSASKIAGATPDAVSRDLEHFVSSWRDRVRGAAPEWLATYDRLVDEATRDGVALPEGILRLDRVGVADRMSGFGDEKEDGSPEVEMAGPQEELLTEKEARHRQEIESLIEAHQRQTALLRSGEVRRLQELDDANRELTSELEVERGRANTLRARADASQQANRAHLPESNLEDWGQDRPAASSDPWQRDHEPGAFPGGSEGETADSGPSH